MQQNERCVAISWRRAVRNRLLARAAFSAILITGAVGCMNAATISFQTISTGQTVAGGEAVYQEIFSISGLTLRDSGGVQDELDIQFNPNDFGILFNGAAPAGFNVLLFQPGVPPQAQGDYTALAMVDNPSFAGSFSVDFTWIGPGTPTDPTVLSSEPYVINTYSSNGTFLSSTPPAAAMASATAVVAGVPEPDSWALALAGMIAAGTVCSVMRFRRCHWRAAAETERVPARVIS